MDEKIPRRLLQNIFAILNNYTVIPIALKPATSERTDQ